MLAFQHFINTQAFTLQCYRPVVQTFFINRHKKALKTLALPCHLSLHLGFLKPKPMKTKVVKIGKSYGIILPNKMAKELAAKSSLEITSTSEGLLIGTPRGPVTEFYDANTEDDVFLFTDLSHELELEK